MRSLILAFASRQRHIVGNHITAHLVIDEICNLEHEIYLVHIKMPRVVAILTFMSRISIGCK